jgi:hypothetical protein
MDEVNNFIFWRDFIFSHLSSYLIGTKALEFYQSNIPTMEQERFPGLDLSFSQPPLTLPSISPLVPCASSSFSTLPSLCHCPACNPMHG